MWEGAEKGQQAQRLWDRFSSSWGTLVSKDPSLSLLPDSRALAL